MLKVASLAGLFGEEVFSVHMSCCAGRMQAWGYWGPRGERPRVQMIHRVSELEDVESDS